MTVARRSGDGGGFGWRRNPGPVSTKNPDHEAGSASEADSAFPCLHQRTLELGGRTEPVRKVFL